MENDAFWSEIGSGCEEQSDTPQANIPRSLLVLARFFSTSTGSLKSPLAAPSQSLLSGQTCVGCAVPGNIRAKIFFSKWWQTRNAIGRFWKPKHFSSCLTSFQLALEKFCGKSLMAVCLGMFSHKFTKTWMLSITNSCKLMETEDSLFLFFSFDRCVFQA